MIESLYRSPIFSGIIYFGAMIVAVMYIIHKIKQKRLFTLYNITIYIMFFTYFIITPFQFQNKAWKALGQYNAEMFYPYLYKSVSINLLGLIIFLFALMHFENKKKPSKHGEELCLRIQKYCAYNLLCIILVAAAALWLFIVFKYNGGLPLFNGGRTFFYGSGLVSFIYQALTMIISMLALYFGLCWINNGKGGLFFIFGAFLSIATGTRSSFFINIVYPFAIVLLYKKYKKLNFEMIIKIVVIALLLFFLALFLGAYRSGSAAGYSILNALLYGNNFCDIRDGAYMFWGYDVFLNNEVIGGKTYLAGLMSFIPSSLSDFRTEWSWGRFSTMKIFNGAWPNHFGFRGGNWFETYLNFRMPGVIILSIVKAYIFAELEIICNVFIFDRIADSKKIYPGSIVFILLLTYLYSIFNVSGGFSNLYVIIVFILFVKLAYKALSPKKYQRNTSFCKEDKRLQ